jgi:hypothetical protein
MEKNVSNCPFGRPPLLASKIAVRSNSLILIIIITFTSSGPRSVDGFTVCRGPTVGTNSLILLSRYDLIFARVAYHGLGRPFPEDG